MKRQKSGLSRKSRGGGKPKKVYKATSSASQLSNYIQRDESVKRFINQVQFQRLDEESNKIDEDSDY